jgi:hypothetical protein
MPETEYIVGNVGDLDNYVGNVQANIGEIMKNIPAGHMGSGPLTAANPLPPARVIRQAERQEEGGYPVFPGVREMSEEVEEPEEEAEMERPRSAIDTSSISPRMAKVFNSIKGVISMISAVEDFDKRIYVEISDKAFTMIDESMREISAEIALLVYDKMKKKVQKVKRIRGSKNIPGGDQT